MGRQDAVGCMGLSATLGWCNSSSFRPRLRAGIVPRFGTRFRGESRLVGRLAARPQVLTDASERVRPSPWGHLSPGKHSSHLPS
jgi:hypothetical protein